MARRDAQQWFVDTGNTLRKLLGQREVRKGISDALEKFTLNTGQTVSHIQVAVIPKPQIDGNRAEYIVVSANVVAKGDAPPDHRFTDD